MKEKDERQEKRRGMKEEIVFSKNVSTPKNPTDEIVQKVSNKSFSDELFLILPSRVQNLRVFSIFHMIRNRFFGPRELIQRRLSVE